MARITSYNVCYTKLLRILLQGIHFTGDFSPALQDQVISFAEKISTILLAAVLEQNKLKSQIIFPEELGLVVSEEFGNASIYLEESQTAIKAHSYNFV